jgi:hypothetical protein
MTYSVRSGYGNKNERAYLYYPNLDIPSLAHWKYSSIDYNKLYN